MNWSEPEYKAREMQQSEAAALALQEDGTGRGHQEAELPQQTVIGGAAVQFALC